MTTMQQAIENARASLPLRQAYAAILARKGWTWAQRYIKSERQAAAASYKAGNPVPWLALKLAGF